MSKLITTSHLSTFLDSLKKHFVSRSEYEIDMNRPSTDPDNTKWIEIVYPVGSIYMSVSNINPNLLFGIGEWEAIEDRFLLGAGSRMSGEIGGEETHTLTIDELPSHSHQYKRHSLDRDDTDPTTGKDAYGVSNKTLDERLGTTELSGGNQPHNNMPPYLTVYMWKRIN
jgi:hypothetical protein